MTEEAKHIKKLERQLKDRDRKIESAKDLIQQQERKISKLQMDLREATNWNRRFHALLKEIVIAEIKDQEEWDSYLD